FIRVRARNANPAAAVAKPTGEATRGPIRLSVSSTGRVESNLDVEIKCKASGQVITLPYDVSDPVKKGDLLVELDPVDESRNEKQAETDLAASEAKMAQSQQSLETAQMDLEIARRRADAAVKSAKAKADDAAAKAERMNKLLEAKRVSQEEYDTARTAAIQASADTETAQAQFDDLKVQEKTLEIKRQDVKVAEAVMQSNQISLDQAKQRLTDTKVYAPMDGVVSQRDVQIGQIISSPMNNVGGGTTLLTLSDLSKIFVVASIDESDIGVVQVGQPSAITVDAFPDERFAGEVVRIATQGVIVSNVVTFEVKIEVTSPNKGLLKPQMTANVEVIAQDKDDALYVPAEAVYRKRGQRFVALAGAGDTPAEERPVKVGIDNGIEVEILDGLSEGEKVVLDTSALAKQGESKPGGPPMMMMMRGGGGKR
ncbi:MAG: efflux RND transporter periplasmic adaptor subunit, partial [Candidatus Sumerlaeota bacterium]|nr:efflux RND transporter periplasmic adaptor subunit [Candidatus Sumerlaeota bacterium]